MLLSMTGFGEAQRETDSHTVSVEVRTVNNRYLKSSIRLTDGYASLEPRIESILRHSIRRGTVQVTVRIQNRREEDDFRLNVEALESYRRQLAALCAEWKTPQPIDVGSLLQLPGVVDDRPRATASGECDAAWPLVSSVLGESLESLQRMRREEGAAMAADICTNLDTIGESLEAIRGRAPSVAEEYRGRITDRVQKILAEHDIAIDASDVVREVAIYADRCDISEEIVRLESHVEQFRAIMDSKEIAGRKLDFFTQEMVREVNTIGSKANDVEIARRVVDAKAALERIREMIQNVE